MATQRAPVAATASLLLAIAGGVASADTWTVQYLNPTAGLPGGEVDFASIQDAIDSPAVGNGDTILVYGPGLTIADADPTEPYPEAIDLGAKQLVIVGEHESERIIIRPLIPDPGSPPAQVVRIAGGQTDETRLENFSIRTPSVPSPSGDARPPVRGLYLDGVSARILGCGFIDLLAERGAGVLIENGGSPLISNCEVRNCDTPAIEAGAPVTAGGGIYIDGASPVIEGCVIEGCFGLAGGGGLYMTGDSAVLVRTTVFSMNSTEAMGGAIHAAHTEQGSLGVSKTDFVENDAKLAGGAAALLGQGPSAFVSCDFEDNVASNDLVATPALGGAIFHSVAVPTPDPTFPPDALAVCTVVNSRLAGNRADRGAAVSAMHPAAVTSVVNTTAGKNTASPGQAAFQNLAHLSIENSIVYFNTPEVWVRNELPAHPPVCFSSDLQRYVPAAGDSGCFDENPWFRDRGARDFRIWWFSGCRDKGENDRLPLDVYDIDLDGDTSEPLPWDLDRLDRVFGTSDPGRVDMGCYEARSGGPCNEADVGQPWGVLDLRDINVFIDAFVNRTQAADLAAAYNVWDLHDLNTFVSAFVAGCP